MKKTKSENMIVDNIKTFPKKKYVSMNVNAIKISEDEKQGLD